MKKLLSYTFLALMGLAALGLIAGIAFAQSIPVSAPIVIYNTGNNIPGTGPYSPSTFTTNRVLWGNGSGAILTTAPGGSSVVDNGSGQVTVAASGTNQNVVATPSGTGKLKIIGASETSWIGALTGVVTYGALTFATATPSGTNYSLAGDGSSTYLNAPSGGQTIIALAGAEIARFAPTTGNLHLGGLVADGTGLLQFPAGTTNASGLNFGTEIYFFRTGTNTAQITATSGLTLSGPQVITGTNTLKFGATANATLGVAADATSSNLNIIGPQGTGTVTIATGNNVTAVTFDGSQNSIHAGNYLKTGKRLVPQVTSTATAAGTTTLTTSSTLVQIFTGSTTQNVTLTAANLDGAGFGTEFIVKNLSSGTVTINRAGSDTIDGATSYALLAGTSVTLISDGVSSWTLN